MTDFVVPPVYTGDGRGAFNPSVYARPLDPEPEPYPVPLITSRDGAPCPTKVAVTSLIRYAEAFGWTVWTTYALGYPSHSKHGTPLGLQESIAVRMIKDDRAAFAIYAGSTSWAWKSFWTRGGGCKPMSHASLGTFKDALKA